ncbi:MAG: hypothetical protein IPH16_12375 [Haliscomenobacter sp.]|nr:hypothetical protein [Haliscomenobacter sp.]MBK7474513.1 hypothetical protein [Haliscomenobacter sp.]MBK8880616.1 hypothetical protein [Haliscomenobacter sp.]
MKHFKLPVHASILTGLVFLAAMSRFIPHPPNFTPLGAIALFGAAFFQRRALAFAVPFAALWISDLVLNNLIYAKAFPQFYDGFVWYNSLAVYVGFLLIVVLGISALKSVTPLRLGAVSAGASLVFFLATNFGSWLIDPLYPKNIGGLSAAYLAGIPFFWNTLMGDLFYCAILFGSYGLISKFAPGLALRKA